MTMTSSSIRFGSPRRYRTGWRVALTGPALVGLVVVGAGAANADEPDSTLVVGVPNATNSSGAVDNRMRYGAGHVLNEGALGQARAGIPGTRFGAALLTGVVLDREDPRGAPYDDMIIGAPGTPTTGVPGEVFLVFGDVEGFWKPPVTVLESHVAATAEFGAALSLSSRFDSSGQDLWVGAPGHDVAGKVDAGAVLRYRISPTGTATYLETITQDSPLVPGSAEAGDRFGEVMGLGGMVGVPREDIGSLKDAGTVLLLRTDPDTNALIAAEEYNQDRGDISGIAEAGDRFGAAVSGSRVIGVPGEDVGNIKDAGMVQQIGGKSFSQNTAGVPGSAEAGDQFGAAVSRGSYQCAEKTSIAIGAPGEDIGSTQDAGTVTLVLTSGSLSPTDPQFPCLAEVLREGSSDVPGAAESGDRFGASLSMIDGMRWAGDEEYFRATLLIGVPGEDVGTKSNVGRVISREWESLRTYSYATFNYADGDVAGMQFGTVLPKS